MDKKKTDLIIMYYEIKRLRNDEKLSIQRIADFLGMNFRTVRKYLNMAENEYEVYLTSIGDRPYIMDPYKQFIINYLTEWEMFTVFSGKKGLKNGALPFTIARLTLYLKMVA